LGQFPQLTGRELAVPDQQLNPDQNQVRMRPLRALNDKLLPNAIFVELGTAANAPIRTPLTLAL
jgi:hypothetical protein